MKWKSALMRKLYENFHIFYLQKRIVSAEAIRGNTVCVRTFKLKKNIGKVKKCIFWQNSLYPDFIQIFEKTHSGYNLGLNQIKIEINIGLKLTWAGLFRGWRSLVSFTKHAQKNFIKHQRHWEHECYESVDERWTSQTNLVC